MTQLSEEGGSKPRCARCKGKGVIVVDRGLHYIYCQDCHPAWADFRAKQQKLANG
jgi:excinuclease UvrABC ATPase subunit